MTRHLKLENGDIVTVGTEESPSTTVGSIIGTLIGIIDGEQDKVCFIFRNGDDIDRFYLDRGGRPASRLLILLCSRIDGLRDARLEIRSHKQSVPGQSRLQLAFTDGGENGIAPYILPNDHARWNRIRIARILAALGIATEEVCTGETDSSVETPGDAAAENASQQTPVEAVVVQGIRPADSAVTERDTRSVRLVAGFPLMAAVWSDPDPARPVLLQGATIVDNIRAIIDAFPSSTPRFINRVFRTLEIRRTFESGIEAALDGTDNRHVFLIHNRPDIDAVLRLMSERGIDME